MTRFHADSLAGRYYESFAVNSKSFMDQSLGTERFIAELERLVTRCTRAASKGSRGPVRHAFELLFALLRHIDECEDDVIFFADEGGAWQMGVDWKNVLPAYFRCLAETAGPEEFAREAVVDAYDDEERRMGFFTMLEDNVAGLHPPVET